MFGLPLTPECLTVRDQALTEDSERAGRSKPHTHIHIHFRPVQWVDPGLTAAAVTT